MGAEQGLQVVNGPERGGTERHHQPWPRPPIGADGLTVRDALHQRRPAARARDFVVRDARGSAANARSIRHEVPVASAPPADLKSQVSGVPRKGGINPDNELVQLRHVGAQGLGRGLVSAHTLISDQHDVNCL